MGFLQSHVVTALVYYRPLGTFDAGHDTLPHSAQQPLDVEMWSEFRFRQGRPPTQAPAWEEPSAAQACPTALLAELCTCSWPAQPACGLHSQGAAGCSSFARSRRASAHD